MFRLIKLLAYTAVGYFIYQLWQGMRDAESGGEGGQAGGSRGSGGSQARRNLKRALNEDQGRMTNMTGTGRGTKVDSEDERSGMSVPHVVGRGVVSR